MLRGKVILVTGSTAGIGRSIVIQLAEEGAAVMVHGLEAKRAQAVVAEIEQAGGRAASVIADLAEPSAVRRIVQETIATFGRLDALVNNAATVVRSDLQTTDAALFDRIMAVNLRAPLLLIREAYSYFIRQGGGRVLNIGSVNAYCGERDLLAYSISKAGLITLTRNLADAYGHDGIRVNAMNVGWTLTENEYALQCAAGMPSDWPEHLPPHFVPSGRLLQPEEIAAAAVYFMSDQAVLINGAVLDLEQYPMIGRNPVKQFHEKT